MSAWHMKKSVSFGDPRLSWPSPTHELGLAVIMISVVRQTLVGSSAEPFSHPVTWDVVSSVTHSLLFSSLAAEGTSGGGARQSHQDTQAHGKAGRGRLRTREDEEEQWAVREPFSLPVLAP